MKAFLRFWVLAGIAGFSNPAAFAQVDDANVTALAQRAKQAEQTGDYSTAINAYRALARLLPDNPQVRTNLGIAFYLAKDNRSALDELLQVSRDNSGLFPAHLFAGLAAYKLGDRPTAEGELLRAAALNKSDPLAHLWLGYLYSDQSRYEQAVPQLQAVLSLRADDADALFTLGNAYAHLGRQRTAELVETAPDGGRTWQMAAEQCRLRGDEAKALDLYRAAYARRPDLVELRDAVRQLHGSIEEPADHAAVGGPGSRREDQLYRQAHSYESLARTTFEQLGRVAPDSYRAHQMIAAAHAAAGQSSEAIAEYSAVLDRKPDLSSVNESIGSEYLKLGKAAEAAKYFRAEIALQPGRSRAQVGLAQALALLGEDAEAQQVLKLVGRTDNPPPTFYRLSGKYALEGGHPEEAVRYLGRYLELMPADSTAHYLLSRAYRSLKRNDAANAELIRARQESKDVKTRTAAQLALSQFAAAQSN